MAVDPDKLIDDIYEACFAPDLWPRILHGISEQNDLVGGTLYCKSQDNVRWLASQGMAQAMTAFVEQGWISKDSRPFRTLERQYAGFVTEEDLYSQEELSKSSIHAEFLRPNGIGWSAGTVMTLPTGDLITFGFDQRYDKGPISRDIVCHLNALRPHLARAALTSTRLELERARGVVGALERMGLPGAVLTQTGRVIAANPALEALKEQVVFRAFDKMAFRTPAADTLFTDGIRKCRHNRKAVGSFALPGNDGVPPAIAHLLPVHGQAHDIFTCGEIVLVVTPLAKVDLPQANVLAALFDFTPQEARIARWMCDGHTAQTLAKRFSLSPLTVNTYAKAVRAKAGVGRMIELARLLSAGTVASPH